MITTSETSQRKGTLWELGLIGSAIAMSVLFWSGLTSRYNLNTLADLPQQSVGDLNNYDDVGALRFILTFVALFAVYAFGYICVNRLSAAPGRRRVAATIVGAAVIFNFVLLPLYPMNSLDIFEYVIRGRIASVYDANPYIHPPREIPNDPFYEYIYWQNVVSSYGPLWTTIEATTTRLAGDSVTGNVYAFKLVTIAGYALSILFIGAALWRRYPRRVLSSLLLFAWNPFVLYITAGTGHNDAVMTACITGSLFFLMGRRYLPAMAAATLGGLIKFIPLMLLPVIVIVALRALSDRDRIRFLVLSALICSALAALTYGPYWYGPGILQLERRSAMIDGSVGSVLRNLMITIVDRRGMDRNSAVYANANEAVALATLVLFAGFYLTQLWLAWRDRDTMTPIRVITRILACYLFVASIWFQGWYVVWLLPPAAMLEKTPLRRLVVVFSFLVVWQELLKYYLVMVPRGGTPALWVDLVPVTVYMAYPWAYTLWYQVGARVRRGTRHPADVAIGAILREQRCQLGQTLSELSDATAIRFDVLGQYERGERPLRLDHARILADYLNVTEGELSPASFRSGR